MTAPQKSVNLLLQKKHVGNYLFEENSVTSPRSGALPNMEKQKILVVEDEEMTARLIIYRLKALGYDVSHARDGVEGMGQIKKIRPDLVVLDIMLPGLSGFEILEELKADPEFDSSGIKVLMLTNKKSSGDVSRGFNLGAMEYVSKPFKMEEFLLRMDRVLKT